MWEVSLAKLPPGYCPLQTVMRSVPSDVLFQSLCFSSSIVIQQKLARNLPLFIAHILIFIFLGCGEETNTCLDLRE